MNVEEFLPTDSLEKENWEQRLKILVEKFEAAEQAERFARGAKLQAQEGIIDIMKEHHEELFDNGKQRFHIGEFTGGYFTQTEILEMEGFDIGKYHRRYGRTGYKIKFSSEFIKNMSKVKNGEKHLERIGLKIEKKKVWFCE